MPSKRTARITRPIVSVGRSWELTEDQWRHTLDIDLTGTWRTVKTVIVDEIHAIADDKRGAHLALSLERLEALTKEPPTRIGLSATQKPMELIGQFA